MIWLDLSWLSSLVLYNCCNFNESTLQNGSRDRWQKKILQQFSCKPTQYLQRWGLVMYFFWRCCCFCLSLSLPPLDSTMQEEIGERGQSVVGLTQINSMRWPNVLIQPTKVTLLYKVRKICKVNDMNVNMNFIQWMDKQVQCLIFLRTFSEFSRRSSLKHIYCYSNLPWHWLSSSSLIKTREGSTLP